VSTPGLALPRPLPRPADVLPVAVPVAGALLLGIALGAGIPALALVALLPFGVAIVMNPTGATVAFAFAFYLNLPAIAVSHGLPATVTAVFALVLGVPLVRHLIVRRDPVVLTPAVGLMVGYLAALVLSALVTQTPGSQAAGAITTFLTEGLLLVVLVINAVRTPDMLRLFIWALLAAGAVMGLLSIYQELTHSYSNTFGGLAKVNEEGFGVGEGLFGTEVRPRLAGPIGEQNRFAQVLLVLLPLAVGRVKAERTLLLRGLAAAAGTLIVCGVMLTFSRGAAVALLLLLAVMVATGFVALRHMLALAAVLLALVLAVAPDYISRVQTLGAAGDAAALQSEETDQAIKGRATENLAALNAFRDHPILGVGPDQFFRRYSTQYGNELGLRFLEENRRAHNLYLEIGADLGVVGLVAFLSIVVVTMAHLWRLARWWQDRRPELGVLAMGALLSLVAYMASGIFLQLAFQRYFWLLIALGSATIWILSHERATPSEHSPARA
jgi:O-antigen ligase